MNVEIKTDISGATAKIAILKKIPMAQKRNLTEWGAETVRVIKEQMRGGGGSFGFFRRTPAELHERTGMKVEDSGPTTTLTVGTGGYVGKAEAVYARIQEEGGTVTPKGHAYLAIPLPGVKGNITDYPGGFFFTSKRGNLLYSAPVLNRKASTSAIYSKAGETNVLRPLFLMRRSVTLPARHWFTRPVNARLPELYRTMSAEAVLATANAMAGGYKQGTGG